jgi:murein DD-endopeptidase MepM/ murein hydrolase activator NlpD
MRRVLLLLCLAGAGCSDDAEICQGFAPWETSAYVLPFATGSSHFVSGGNCETRAGGHLGVKKFGYDFDMPIGTSVAAARAGIVLRTEASHLEGEISETGNYLVVLHEEGTTALYGHITHNGVVVSLGDVVQAGTPIGLSGNTGNTGTSPHLHFSVQSCDPVSRGTAGCPTLPVTFRNTEPNPAGLQVGRVYQALPY